MTSSSLSWTAALSPMARHLLAPSLLATCLAAQAITLRGPATPTTSTPGVTHFGRSLAMLNDMNGGGRREILVGAPGLNDGFASTIPSGTCYVMAGEGPYSPTSPTQLASISWFQVPGIPSTGVALGHAVCNVGDLNSDGREDFAISAPTLSNAPSLRGEVYIMALTGPSFQPTLLGYLRGFQTFGTSLAMVNTQQGRRLAVGVPGVDQVQLFNLSGPLTPTTAPVRVLDSGGRQGFMGWSLAVGPGGTTTSTGTPPSILVAGAPNYSSSVTTPQGEGFVAVWDLSLPGNSPTSFLYRGVPFEGLGTAVASVGFLPPSGGIFSPRSDFVALGRGSFSSILAMFHTPQTLSTVPTPTLASVTLPGSFVVTDGKMTEAGDINADNFGDFAVALAGSLRIYSTANNLLTQVLQTGATTYCGLANGADALSQGTTDVLAGSAFVPAAGSFDTARVLPIASYRRLQWSSTVGLPPTINLTHNGQRPITGTPFTLTATNNSGPASDFIFLLGDLAPAVPALLPSPFAAGQEAYVRAGVAVTLGSGTSPLSVPLSVPINQANLYFGLVYQAVVVPSNGGPWRVSNGLLARIGAF